MKGRKKLRDRFSKRIEAIIFIVSAALSFTLLLFEPLRLYCSCQAAFTVEFRYILLPLLAASAAGTLLLALILNLLLLAGEVPCRIGICLFSGLLLAGCIQQLFLNDTPVLRPNDMRYSEYKGDVVLDTVIWFTAALLPTVIYIASFLIPEGKLRGLLRGSRVAISAAAVICAGQAAASGVALAGTDLGKYEGIHREYLSYKPTFSLSKESNIVVFLTDRLDSYWMDGVLERYPDAAEKFEGFTFYQNAVSHGTSTFPVVPQLLTNKQYTDEEWFDYVNDAWTGDTLTQRLKNEGYSINLIPDGMTTVGSPAQLSGQCDNIVECSEDSVSMNYFRHKGVVEMMARLSAAEFSPYILKHNIRYWMGANFARDMRRFDTSLDDLHPCANGVEVDLKYRRNLMENGLDADSESPTFSFIHLNCSHNVDQRLVDLFDSSEYPDEYSTTRGDFEILFYYFDELKRLGIYDNTTIIVMGDHARAPRELCGYNNDLDEQLVTAIAIKPANAEKAPIQYDRYTPISTDNIPASILEYAGADRSGAGYSVNDIAGMSDPPDRYMCTYWFSGYGRMVEKSIYKISGDARDFGQWERTDSDKQP